MVRLTRPRLGIRATFWQIIHILAHMREVCGHEGWVAAILRLTTVLIAIFVGLSQTDIGDHADQQRPKQTGKHHHGENLEIGFRVR